MKRFSRAFALPTVLITSLIMMSVLAVAVQVVATTTSTLGAGNYNQMATAAAQAGVAYAQACMANNNNQVTWSNTKPLQPNTDCTGTATTTCTSNSTNAACWVMQNANVHTSFSVGVPGLAGDGSLLQITSAGSAAQLRTSDHSVWRTYTQNATQEYASTCLTTTQQTPGWQNATVDQSSIATTQNNWTGPTTAGIRTLAGSSATLPGPVWYRKDFTAVIGGTYTLDMMGDNRYAVYIDGQPIFDNRTGSTTASVNTLKNMTVTLTPGCHTLTTQVLNFGATSSPSWFAAALIPPGSSAPLISTDATWRTTTSQPVSFGAPNFYTDSTSWVTAKDFGQYSDTSTAWGSNSTAISNWLSTTGAHYAEWIGTPDGSDGSATDGNYPASSYAEFVDNQPITVSSTTAATLYGEFDDVGQVYLDGQPVMSGSGSTNIVSASVSLSPGTHRIAVVLYNNTASPSGFLLALKENDSSDDILASSNGDWVTNDTWTSAGTAFTPPTTYDPTWAPAVADASDSVTNLVTNPSFESGATTNWTAHAATLSVGTDGGSNGSDYLKITPDGSSTDSYATVPLSTSLVAGNTYTVRANMAASTFLAGPLATDHRWLSIAVVWNGAIQAEASPPNMSETLPLVLTFTIPSGATGVSVRLYNGSSNTNDIAEWDSVMVTAGPMVYPYRDGNSSGWSWSGTTNRSASSGKITVGASS